MAGKSKSHDSRINVYINDDNAGDTLKSLYDQKKKVNNELARMKIGTEEYIAATQKIKEINGRLDDHRKAIGAVSKSQGELVKETGLFNRELGMLQGGFSKVKAGIGVAVNAFGTLKGAIIGTGIGALVIAFVSLVTYFTKTERGARGLKVIMAGVGQVFALLTDAVSALGEVIVSVFTDPVGTIKTFSQTVKDSVSDSFDAAKESASSFGDMVSAIFSGDKVKSAEALKSSLNSLSKALLGASLDEISEASDTFGDSIMKAAELEEQMQRLTDIERKLGVEHSKRRAEIKELNLIAEDTTKSEAVRARAAEDAFKKEQQLMNIRVQAAEHRLRIIKEQNALSESMEKDLQAEADAEIALNNIRLESADMQTTLQNKLNTINAAAEAKRKKAFDDEKRRIEELQGFITKTQEDLILSQMSAEEREIRIIENKYAAMIEKAAKYEEQRKELERLRDEELAMKEAEQAERKAIEEEQFIAAKKAFEDQLHALTLEGVDAEINAIRKRYEDLYKLAEEFGVDVTALKKLEAKEIKEIEDKADADSASAQKKRTIAMLIELQSRYSTMASLAGAFVTISNNINELAGKSGEEMSGFAKAAALFQIGASTVVGIAKAVEDGMKMGITPIEKSLAIAAGIGLVTTNMVAAKKILGEQKQPKAPSLPDPTGFAEGGYTGNGSGSPDVTGYKPSGIVHQDEWVAPKWMTDSPLYANTIGYLEAARTYQIGRYAEGGTVSAPPSPAGVPMPDFSKALEEQNKINRLLLHVLSRPIQAVFGYEAVQDIQRAAEELDDIQSSSTI